MVCEYLTCSTSFVNPLLGPRSRADNTENMIVEMKNRVASTSIRQQVARPTETKMAKMAKEKDLLHRALFMSVQKKDRSRLKVPYK